jgi:5-methylcytosine-specific restriction endonuclease McrA
LDVLLDEYMESHSPERILKRRKEREARKESAAKKKQTAINKRSTSKIQEIKSNRHIPAASQDVVYTRDQGRCVYNGPGGTKCNSTWNLQIDHIKPFAKGGDHSMGNLRLLCARHNKFEAERVYGGEFIKNKMASSTKPHRE